MDNNKTVTASTTTVKSNTKKQPYWLIYGSIFLAGLMLLADAFRVTALQKVSARLGVTLIISALNLIIGRNTSAGYIATVIIVGALLITFFA
ncbi:MAG: hypothetical protein ACOYVF_08255 [Candidatus Zixiibacteriota bacterium]